MKFKECLKLCIAQCNNPEYKQLYLDYPRPTKKIWEKCTPKLDEIIIDATDYAMNYMANYEAKLYSYGIETVSGKRVLSALSLIRASDEVSWKVVKSIAKYNYALKLKHSPSTPTSIE